MCALSAQAETPTEAAPATPGWMRVLIVTGSVIAVLLLGAAGGLLLGLAQTDRPVTPGPDSVDVGFAQDMSVHHRQGVLMAAIARERSVDPAIRLLAFDIESTQLEQIGRMQGWLSLWDAAALPTGPHMTWMSGMTGMPGHSGHSGGGSAGVAVMPGMATDEEIARLRTLSGVEFDILFCQLMVRHHQGGVPMMREAEQRATVAQVRNLAAQMQTSQTKEVDYLIDLLAQRGAQPLPAPS